MTTRACFRSGWGLGGALLLAACAGAEGDAASSGLGANAASPATDGAGRDDANGVDGRAPAGSDPAGSRPEASTAAGGRSEGDPAPELADSEEPSGEAAGPEPAEGGLDEEDTPLSPAPDVSDRGFSVGGNCLRGCASSATDADATGNVDGFGFEDGESCVVGNSGPAQASVACDPFVLPVLAPQPNADGIFVREPNGGCPPASQITCPLGLPRNECGCFIIDDLGARKAEVLNAAVTVGAVPLDFLTSGSFESETYNTDYPFGDVFPDGRSKTGGAANFGITKMNWSMIRRCHPAYAGLNDAAYQRGAEINDDLLLEATIYRECRAFFGINWLAGHRNGFGNINNSNTADIRRFIGVYEWLGEMYADGHLTDDTRWYTNVPAI